MEQYGQEVKIIEKLIMYKYISGVNNELEANKFNLQLKCLKVHLETWKVFDVLFRVLSYILST